MTLESKKVSNLESARKQQLAENCLVEAVTDHYLEKRTALSAKEIAVLLGWSEAKTRGVLRHELECNSRLHFTKKEIEVRERNYNTVSHTRLVEAYEPSRIHLTNLLVAARSDALAANKETRAVTERWAAETKPRSASELIPICCRIAAIEDRIKVLSYDCRRCGENPCKCDGDYSPDAQITKLWVERDDLLKKLGG